MTGAEKAKVHDLVQDLLVAIDADLEQGVHWLNEVASAEFTKNHPRTMQAIAALCGHTENWGPED
jgi:hypothetical protein